MIGHDPWIGRPGGGAGARYARRMVPTGATMLDINALACLYRQVGGGWAEILGALAQRPLLVVDLDSAR